MPQESGKIPAAFFNISRINKYFICMNYSLSL